MSKELPEGIEVDGRGLRFALCVSRWNGNITGQLLQGAQALLEKRSAEFQVYRCAGAFELGPLAARVARKGKVDGIIALGCLVRGGTDHYSLLADEVTRALGLLALEGATAPEPLAVSFGVLTCDTMEQAEERADPRRGDKGGEAASTCIEQVRALRAVGE
jgi:6,7-dimethyl-8-ribityllumazine synthase